MVKDFTDVVIYKDPNFKTCYPKTYSVEVVWNKARVINPNPNNWEDSRVSRLNKLTPIGKDSNFNLYRLNVNGDFVYIKLNYRLP